MCQSAVERELTIIGEASKKILDEPGEFVGNHPEIPFKKAYALRIKLTHGYTSINARTVWGTIREDLPGFAQDIRNILPDLLKERDNIRKKERDKSSDERILKNYDRARSRRPSETGGHQ